MPKNSKSFINERQIKNLATLFIQNYKTKNYNKQYCSKIFQKKSKVCEKFNKSKK